MKALLIALSVLTLLMTSCSEVTTPSEEAGAQRDSTITIGGLGRELFISVSRELAQSKPIQSMYTPAIGAVEITAGENLRVFLTEDSMSIAGLKEELENDVFYSYRYEEEKPNELIFVQVLPDGTEFSYQFIRRHVFSGITVVSRSDPSEKYTKQDIQTLMTILGNLQTASS